MSIVWRLPCSLSLQVVLVPQNICSIKLKTAVGFGGGSNYKPKVSLAAAINKAQIQFEQTYRRIDRERERENVSPVFSTATAVPADDWIGLCTKEEGEKDIHSVEHE